jgi:very-short-patch-repair endonuclease
MVVEGHNDSRLAIECDGDRYHDSSKWGDAMNRQRILERAGWKFWRCFASNFVLNRKQVTNDSIETLILHGIEPIGADGVVNNIHCEYRTIKSLIDLES